MPPAINKDNLAADQIRAMLADARLLAAEHQTRILEGLAERERLNREIAGLRGELANYQTSAKHWLGAGLHHLSRRYPWFGRQILRLARVTWWTMTLQVHRRFPELLRERREAQSLNRAAQALPEVPPPPTTVLPPQPVVPDLLLQRFGSLRPFPVYQVPSQGRRLTIVTDSINEGSMFGGVATSIIFGALLANRNNLRLRIL